eukprot:11526614-Alexandrium_andersonii.AAC.1
MPQVMHLRLLADRAHLKRLRDRDRAIANLLGELGIGAEEMRASLATRTAATAGGCWGVWV